MHKTDLQTEQLILEAARRVFQRSGYGGARMQEIAEEAKISKASLHYYFRSKDKLFHTVFRVDIRIFLVPLVGILRDPALTLDTRMRTFVRTYINTLLENQGLPLFIMQELSSNPGRLISLVEETVPGIGKKSEDEPSGGDPTSGRQFDNTYLEAGVDETPPLAVFIRQIRDGMEAGECRKVDPEQFILSMISMCVFPFIGRPLIQLLLKKDKQEYRDFLARREEEILEYLFCILYTDGKPEDNSKNKPEAKLRNKPKIKPKINPKANSKDKPEANTKENPKDNQ